jgi:hypothetical protein
MFCLACTHDSTVGEVAEYARRAQKQNPQDQVSDSKNYNLVLN